MCTGDLKKLKIFFFCFLAKPQAVVASKMVLTNGAYNSVPAGNSRIVCEGRGNPKPSVMWTRNGIPGIYIY